MDAVPDRLAQTVARRGDAKRAYVLAAIAASLAGMHLADPTHGDPQRIGEQTTTMERLLEDDERVTPVQRVDAAAAARERLAGLIRKHRAIIKERDRGWVIGTGGWVRYMKEQRRYLRAMLPSCAGLPIDDEAAALDGEAAAMRAGLTDPPVALG
jgi:hypothetical protein